MIVPILASQGLYHSFLWKDFFQVAETHFFSIIKRLHINVKQVTTLFTNYSRVIYYKAYEIYIKQKIEF